MHRSNGSGYRKNRNRLWRNVSSEWFGPRWWRCACFHSRRLGAFLTNPALDQLRMLTKHWNPLGLPFENTCRRLTRWCLRFWCSSVRRLERLILSAARFDWSEELLRTDLSRSTTRLVSGSHNGSGDRMSLSSEPIPRLIRLTAEQSWCAQNG